MALDLLCGSQNVARILFFLFVNEKCYGTQLQRLLNVPLTPIQKGLARLEKAGIIASCFEGKTRLYRLNPSYPLHSELLTLLQKAYTLLPPQEKKQYLFIKPSRPLSYREKMERQEEASFCLMALWEVLGNVKSLVFEAKAKTQEDAGANGIGRGSVSVLRESDTVLTFTEAGKWKGGNGKELDFSNAFRWTLDLKAGLIALEHLRFGINHPVFLFHLAPSGKNTLEAVNPHLCVEDHYFGIITYDASSIQFQWRIIGPKKDEMITYDYRCLS